MTTFLDLPPEVLAQIFIILSPVDGANLSSCCKSLRKVYQIELIWETKVRREFGINLSRSPPDEFHEKKLPSNFYKIILHRFGKILGLWQPSTLKHHGSLLQVAYDNWSLRVFEWFAPKNPHVKEKLRTLDLCSIGLDDSGDNNYKVTISNEWLYLGLSSADNEVILVVQQDGEKLGIALPPLLDIAQDPDVWNEKLLKFVSFDLAEEFESPESMLPRVHLMSFTIAKFITRFNCCSVYGYIRPSPRDSWLPPKNWRENDWPLPRGIFKGTYGAHGINIVAVNYSEQNLIGTKMTGDPNVPVQEVTFKADLGKNFMIPREIQENSTCQELIEATEALTFIDASKGETGFSQPFVLPRDCDHRAGQDPVPDFCRARLVGSGQIAKTNFTDPEMTPAHVVIFDRDNFGVLFLSLRSFSAFSRTSENFHAVHYEDIFPED